MIRKCLVSVLPATATRFLRRPRVCRKEELPIAIKPLVQYGVEGDCRGMNLRDGDRPGQAQHLQTTFDISFELGSIQSPAPANEAYLGKYRNVFGTRVFSPCPAARNEGLGHAIPHWGSTDQAVSRLRGAV